MTDAEIIKALEEEKHLAEYVDSDYCSNTEVSLIKSALDLINRQKAEVERLQKDLGIWKDIAHRETRYVDIAKAEAIKEFAEKLKNKLQHRALFSVINTINEVLREIGVISNDK